MKRLLLLALLTLWPAMAWATICPKPSGSNWKLWAEADSITGLNNNDAITTWSDESGNGNDMTQSTTANKPTYITAGINSKASVAFDLDHAGARFFTLGSFMSGFTAGEIFVVVGNETDPQGTPANTGFWNFSSQGATPCCPDTHFPWTEGTIYDSWGTTVRKTVGNPSPSLTTARVYNVQSASGAWLAALDGSTLLSTGTNTVGFATAPTLGRSINAYYYRGTVAMIAVSDSVLSAGDRSIVLNYLTEKWGTGGGVACATPTPG